MDTNTFNATFWLSFCGILSGILALILTTINKSKCKNINCCCGLFACIRDIKNEVALEEYRIEHNTPDTPIINNNNLNNLNNINIK